MDQEAVQSSTSADTNSDLCMKRCKRRRTMKKVCSFSECCATKTATMKTPTKASFRFDPFLFPDHAEEFDEKMYGTTAQEIRELCDWKRKILNPYIDGSKHSAEERRRSKNQKDLLESPPPPPIIIIDSDDDEIPMAQIAVADSVERNPNFVEKISVASTDSETAMPQAAITDFVNKISNRSDKTSQKFELLIIDDQTGKHDADTCVEETSCTVEEVECDDNNEFSETNRNLQNEKSNNVAEDGSMEKFFGEMKNSQVGSHQTDEFSETNRNLQNENGKNVAEDGCVKEFSFDMNKSPVGSHQTDEIGDNSMDEDDDDDDEEEERSEQESAEKEEDGLSNIWTEMAFALECSKDVAKDPPAEETSHEEEQDCFHDFIHRDDLGEVCRVCGLIRRAIHDIIDVTFQKSKKSSRTYARDSQIKNKESASSTIAGNSSLLQAVPTTLISVHQSHMKHMRPHQIQGFNFLCNNLVNDDEPGGCILAHAPGSGKTFMVISFIQSFMTKYPTARPLVVLPKGIIETWKKEFAIWQIENGVQLLDFHSSKAESRVQQLDVLRKWVDQKSILLLGYKQFSTIICDIKDNSVSSECRHILLKIPTVLILDEGHTSRNEDTNVLQSLARVQTRRKVVLSGTLYQNHVKEVFNILNLVRPKFLKLPGSKEIVNRIMSRVEIPRKNLKTAKGLAFFEAIEHTLQNKENTSRKQAVIKDLREMTRDVLHYYKGDFLDELPGLVEFTVMLSLGELQKTEVKKLEKLDKFRQISLGSALYIHPCLKFFQEQQSSSNGCSSSGFDDETIDKMLEKLNVKDGVKLKFFLTILGLCESTGEKLLAFSQYVLPLKFLERFLGKSKGWRSGKEIFAITGDSNLEQREWSMERFNNSQDAKIFFGSIKACGEGISLVGASRVLFLDVHLNPSVTQQAVARAFRPGQKKKVYAYRLVACDSPEEEDYRRCLRKEMISKLWFEWNENHGKPEFEPKIVEIDECGDLFLESSKIRDDIRALFKR